MEVLIEVLNGGITKGLVMKKKTNTQKLQNGQGVVRHGRKTDVFSRELCDKIRKRLKLTKEQLSNAEIKKVVNLGNSILMNWVVDNPEGAFIHPSKNMGMICCSKKLPPQFMPDKEEKIEKIKQIQVSELKRKQILKIYDVEIGDVLDARAFHELGEKVPWMNLSTFFYMYKIIWFNHRNCKLKKAAVYRLDPERTATKKMYDNAINGKDYYELTFDNFYKHKIKSQY